MVNIFYSHSSKDASWIAPLKEVVEAMGHSMYLFVDDQQPGEYIAQKLQSAIKRSDIMMVFLTPNSEKSNYVHLEIGYAIRDNKPIIPLVEVGVSPKVLGMLEGTVVGVDDGICCVAVVVIPDWSVLEVGVSAPLLARRESWQEQQ